jgi:D-amino-acid N-acetyltransferase
MTSVTIRPIQQADEKEWRELFLAYHEYYQIEPNEKVISTTFARFFDDKEPVYAALAVSQDSNRPIGFVHWVTHRSTLAVNDYIYLHDLFVKEDVRSKGVGRKLIEHVYEDADKREAARVYWQTKVRCCSGLIRFRLLVLISSNPCRSMTA